MPSRFLTLFSIAVFLAIAIGAFFYFGRQEKKIEEKEIREEKSHFKELTLFCKVCNHSDTHYDVKKEDLVDLYKCPKCGANRDITQST